MKCSSDKIKKLGPPNPNLDSLAATEEGLSFKVKTKIETMIAYLTSFNDSSTIVVVVREDVPVNRDLNVWICLEKHQHFLIDILKYHVSVGVEAQNIAKCNLKRTMNVSL